MDKAGVEKALGAFVGGDTKAKARLEAAIAEPAGAAYLLSLVLQRIADGQGAAVAKLERDCRHELGLMLPGDLTIEADTDLDALATELVDEGDLETAEAVRRYDALLHPDDPKRELDLAALVSYEVKDHERAAEMLRTSVARFPDDANLHQFLGLVLGLRLGNFAEALSHLRKATELDTRDPAYLSNVAWAAGALGDTALSCEYASRALAQAGNRKDSKDGSATPSWARVEAGFCLYLLGPAAEREARLEELLQNLVRGDKVFDWTFAPQLKHAKKAHHPDAEQLELLASVVTSDAKLEALDAWPKVRNTLSAAKKQRKEAAAADAHEKLRTALDRDETLAKVDFAGMSLGTARLSQLRGDSLVFTRCDLEKASLRQAKLTDCDFVGSNLTDADCTQAMYRQCDFGDAVAPRADFTATDAGMSFFRGTKLRDAIFNCAKLKGTSFHKADLSNALFDEAQCEGTNFTEANLRGASFRNANLKGTDFTGAALKNADFKGADLTGAVLDGADLTGAKFDPGVAETPVALATAELPAGTQAKFEVVLAKIFQSLGGARNHTKARSEFMDIDGSTGGQVLQAEPKLEHPFNDITQLYLAMFAQAKQEGLDLREFQIEFEREQGGGRWSYKTRLITVAEFQAFEKSVAPIAEKIAGALRKSAAAAAPNWYKGVFDWNSGNKTRVLVLHGNRLRAESEPTAELKELATRVEQTAEAAELAFTGGSWKVKSVTDDDDDDDESQIEWAYGLIRAWPKAGQGRRD